LPALARTSARSSCHAVECEIKLEHVHAPLAGEAEPARIQAYRVAAVRRLSLGAVAGLISKYTDGRGLGFSGEPGVNVLELNLALDRLTGGKA
jgi:hypothetical protein